jgi:hypothetical protein
MRRESLTPLPLYEELLAGPSRNFRVFDPLHTAVRPGGGEVRAFPRRFEPSPPLLGRATGFGSRPAGSRSRWRMFRDATPAGFTLNNPLSSAMLPPCEKANSHESTGDDHLCRPAGR